QFILVVTLSLVFALIGPPCLLTLSSQFCCLAMQKNVSQCSKKCPPHCFLRDILAFFRDTLTGFSLCFFFEKSVTYLNTHIIFVTLQISTKNSIISVKASINNHFILNI
ncbi:MAG: hypothetical protein PUG21_00890, partial [Prevotella sp.]|nr:hypothetical protein [Prevotella sp.]